MQLLYRQIFNSPVGNVCAIANKTHVLALFFKDDALGEPRWVEEYKGAMVGICEPLDVLKVELEAYFKGDLKQFKTPILLSGSEFELAVWRALQQIPYGETISYAKQAEIINKPKAFRAVGSANGRNRLSIIVPCHRVVRFSGECGEYAGGVERKQKLIALEMRERGI